MSVSDLTGTKWVLNNPLTIISNVSYSINFTSNGNLYTQMQLVNIPGDSELPSRVVLYFEGAIVAVGTGANYPNATFSTTAYRLITITGGTDATNSTLISWLENNATQVPVVDLSGSEWVFNDEIEYSMWGWRFPYDDHNYGTIYINFTANSNSYNYIYCEDMDGETVAYGFGYGVNGGSLTRVYNYNDYPSRWTSNAYKTISITSGTDATNPDLIAWLSANATYQEPTSSGGIYIGNSPISAMYVGSSEVSKVYMGSELVYEKQSTPTYQVSVSDSYWDAEVYIYDGTNNTGTLLFSGYLSSAQALTVTSGNLYITTNGYFRNSGTATGGVSVVSSTSTAILFLVTGDGTATVATHE